MKKLHHYILVLLLLLAGKNTLGQICKESLANSDIRLFQQKMEFKESAGSEYGYDVKYYRCFWEINPNIFYIKGSVTTYFEPTSGSLSQIGFDMNYNLNIDSVVYHKTKMINSKNQNTSELLINLPKPPALAIIDSITVYYQGIPTNNQQSINQTFHSNIPIIWTLSEPILPGSGPAKVFFTQPFTKNCKPFI